MMSCEIVKQKLIPVFLSKCIAIVYKALTRCFSIVICSALD